MWHRVPGPVWFDRAAALPRHGASQAIVRLVGALLLEQNDEWAVQRARYLTLETIAPLGHDLSVSLPLITA
jgi:hypothetical protein